MPKFKMKVRGRNDEWWEDYNLNEVADQAGAEAWANETIRRFNETEHVRYGDKAVDRLLLEVVFLGAGPAQHEWQKINSFTIVDQHGARDKWRCKNCGCEAFRYGISDTLKRTGKWRAKKHEVCN